MSVRSTSGATTAFHNPDKDRYWVGFEPPGEPLSIWAGGYRNKKDAFREARVSARPINRPRGHIVVVDGNTDTVIYRVHVAEPFDC